MTLSTKPRRVPLLWLLLPFAAGISLARFAPLPQLGLVALLAVGALACALYTSRRSPALWTVATCLALVATGALRYQASQLDLQAVPDFPPREAALELKLHTLFNATHPDTVLGIATVAKTPLHLEAIRGQRIFFFLDSKALSHPPEAGETLAASGVVRRLPPPADRDRFDHYLRNMNVGHTYKQGYALSRAAPAQGLTAWSNQVRRQLSATLGRNSIPDSELSGAFKALMLGQKSELTAEQKQLFLANGTMHLFAISGLHIGVIAMCFHHLLTMLRVKGAARVLATLVAVAAFVITTGGAASSWRALLMIACFYLCASSKRQTSPINALALSAILYLLLLPGQLFQAGFQMSYLTVASILLLGLPLSKTLNALVPLFPDLPRSVLNRFQKKLLTAKQWTLNTLGVSVAAFVSSSLLGVYYFQILPSYGILINLLALPLATGAIVAGFLSLLCSPLPIVSALSPLFNDAALVIIKLIHLVLVASSALPASSIETPAIAAPLAAVAVLSTLALIALAYTQKASPRAPLWQALPLATTLAWLLAFHA